MDTIVLIELPRFKTGLPLAYYARAVSEFSDWCGEHGLAELALIEPVHVAAYVEQLQIRLSAPSVKQHLAALRVLFDWLVVGQVIPTNPAGSVRGPRHSVRKGKTPVLSAAEARAMLDAIDVATPVGLRDRALIGLMVYTFARVGAAIGMRVEDVFMQGRRTWVRLHEKGGKEHEMPCHHNLDEYLHAYRFCRDNAMRPSTAARPTCIRKPASRTGSPVTRRGL